MSLRRGRSLVDSRDSGGGEDGRLVDVDGGERSRNTSMQAPTEISSAGFGSGSTYIVSE